MATTPPPPTPAAQRDSYAPMFVRVRMWQPGGGASGKPVDLPRGTQHYFQSATVEITGQGAWAASIVLHDAENKLHDTVAIAPSRKRSMELSFGVPENAETAPKFTGNIVSVKPEYSSNGITMHFDVKAAGTGSENGFDTGQGGPRNFYLKGSKRSADAAPDATKKGTTTPPAPPATAPATNGKPAAPEARPDPGIGFDAVDWTPSDILFTLAEFWKIDIDDNVFADTAPFPPDITCLSIPRGTGPLAWVLGELVPRARTKTGAPVAFFFNYDTNKWNFKSLEVDPKALPVRTYVVHRNAHGEVFSFQPQDDNYWATVAGLGDATFHGIDSESGIPVPIKSTTAAGLQPLPTTFDAGDTGNGRFQTTPGAITVPDLSPDMPLNGAPSIPAPGLTASGSYMGAAGQQGRVVQQKATLRVKGTHDIKLFDLVEVRYQDATDNSDHPMSGVYRVMHTTHSVDGGGWHTEFALQRQGTNDYFKTLSDTVSLDNAKRDLTKFMDTLAKAGQAILNLFNGQ